MPAPKYFQTEKECNKAYRLYYTKNFTYEEIGKVFGTSKVIVKNLFKRKGWKARDRRTCQLTDGRLAHDPHPDGTGLIEAKDLYILIPVDPSKIIFTETETDL